MHAHLLIFLVIDKVMNCLGENPVLSAEKIVKLYVDPLYMNLKKDNWPKYDLPLKF